MEKTGYRKWIIVLGCFLVIFYSTGLMFNCISIYLNPIMEEYGISNTLRSSMVTAVQCGMLLSYIFVGRVLDKIKARKCILLFSFVVVAGYVFIWLGKSTVFCFIGMFMKGFGYGFTGQVSVTYVLTRWFDKNKGLAISIATAGSGVSTFFAPSIINESIVEHGVNPTLMVHSLVILFLSLIAFIIIKDAPEKGKKGKETSKEPLKFRDMISNRSFIMTGAAALLMGFSTSPCTQHLTPIITQSGYDIGTASMAVSIYGILMLIGKPMLGIIMDRAEIGKANLYVFTMIIIAYLSGLFIKAFTMGPYMLAFGMAFGSAAFNMIAVPIWVNKLFGNENMGGVYAMIKMLYTVGGLFGGAVPGIIMDHTGNYNSLFMIYLFFSMTAYIISVKLFNLQSDQKEHSF